MVVVQDGGTPPRSATGTAHITVLDENDNAPSFTHSPAGRELLLQVRQPAGLFLINPVMPVQHFELTVTESVRE